MSILLTVEQLSAYLHKSVASIRSDATRNPKSLPPMCRLPGTIRLLWRTEDVERWLAQHVTLSPWNPTPAVLDCPPQRRGRPTKAEQVAKQRRVQSSVTGQASAPARS